MTSECRYDGTDCVSKQCAPGCFPDMVSDGVCQEACRAAACQWDTNDCDCFPGCVPALLGNNVCDSVCNVSECQFDSHKCVSAMQGDCAKSCFSAMIGDGVCQSECNSEVCEWDGLDCGCAASCNVSDYGACKDDCMVPDCGYDSLPGFPQCPDEPLKLAFWAMQGYFKSFLARYSYVKYCAPAAPRCSISQWRASYTACIPECASFPPCISSYGHCTATCANLSGCSVCNGSECYACLPSFFAFYTECLPACPVTFHVHVLNPQLCYPSPDSSTLTTPDTFYVAAGTYGQGTGSADEPFPSLSRAFAAIHTRFVRIYLLAGRHTLSSLLPSSYLRVWTYDSIFESFSYDSSVDIDVKALFCADSSHADCVSADYATVVLNNTSPTLFHLRGVVRFEGIRFEGGTSLVANCATDLCTYCPHVSLSGSHFLDDRQTPVLPSSFAQQPLCDVFHPYSFITLESSSILLLSNVVFNGFRQQLRSIIQLTTGTVRMQNVTFSNLRVVGAVVTQNGSDLTATIEVTKSSVSLLNNGYEYAENTVYAGFVDSTSAKSIEITDTVFRFNVMGADGSLISAHDFISLRISVCQFEYNLGQVISIMSAIAIPNDLDANNNLVYFAITHIAIQSTTFTGNTGNSLIIVAFQGDTQNVAIRDCDFTRNLSLKDGLISISSGKLLTVREEDGADHAVLTGSTRVIVHFPKMSAVIMRVQFVGCSVYGKGLLFLDTIANVGLESVDILESGDIGPLQTMYEVTLREYIASGKVYMARPVAGLNLGYCNGLVYFSNVYRLDMFETRFISNRCENGPAGIVGVSLVSESSFASLTFDHNTSVCQTTGAALDITLVGSASFSTLLVTNNLSAGFSGSGIVKLTSSTLPIVIVDSTFESNSAPGGGALFCSGACDIKRSVFKSNISTGGTAAGMLYTPLSTAKSFSLQLVTFVNNSGPVGGGLTITDTLAVPAQIDLRFESTSFTDNKSQRVGSCINITASVTLSDTSLITKSVFSRNTAAVACIYNSFLSGVLVFDECEFSWNTAQSYSVLYSTNPASTATVASRIVLQNSLFEYNKGVMINGFNNIDAFSEGESRNLTFRHNQGRGFFLQWTFWKETGSRFYNNTTSDSSCSFAFLYYSQGIITNSTIEDNYSPNLGAAMYIGGVSVVTLRNCVFSRNTAAGHGGALYVDQLGSLLAYSCKFHGNKAGFEGGVIYFFVGTLVPLQLLDNCSFWDNQSKAGAISVITANATLINCTIHDNTASEAPGLLIYLSDVTVIDSRFYSHSATKGGFVSSPASSTVRLINSSFSQAEASDRGAAVYISSSALEISNSEFHHLSANLGVAISVYSDSTFIIGSSRFFSVASTAVRGGTVFISESKGRVSACDFHEFTNGAIVAESSHIDIDSCEFFNGTSTEGTAVSCSDCPSVSISESVCKGLTAQSAACYSLRTSVLSLPYLIRKCEFESNRGKATGAVLIESADSIISDCDFIDNSAEANSNSTGDGGGIYLSCSQKPHCNVTISNSRFQHNRASHNGGAVYWVHSKPVVTGTFFDNNSAEYGHDLASFAVELAPIDHLRSVYELRNIPSGQPSTYVISVALFDHYKQVVTTDSASLADLFPVFAGNTSVTGSTRVVAKRGVFEFGEYQITYKPGMKTRIKVQTTGIDVRKTQGNESLLAELGMDVQMRDCLIGESQLADLCYICPEGKFSLTPSEACSDCPTGAICLGRSIMVPEPGYWRSSPNSSKFWRCPNEAACLGSPTTVSNLSLTGLCGEGYFGNMCNGCVSGFSRSSSSKCSKCPEKAVNIVRIIGIGLCAILIVVFVIKMSLVSAHRTRSQYSIYLKIFLNYLQLVTVTAAFELAWPGYVLEVFKVQESAGNVSEQVFSFDCFITNGETSTQQEVIFLKVVIVSCIPLFILGVSGLFWGMMAAYSRSWHYLKYEMVNSIVVLFFIAHPSIVKLMFDVFNCKEINPGEFWMNSFLNVRCWNGEHTLYAMAVALPSIILWGVFTPTATLFLLVINRKLLEDLNVRIRFGFLFTGYQADKYFWEFVILYRKVIIIVFAVFFTTISIPVQALCVMMTLIVAFILQMKQYPYLTVVLNELEMRGILVAAITIYCGLFFLTDRIDATSQFVLFLVIIVANAYFLVYWFVQTCKAGCQLFIQWLPRFRGMLLHKNFKTIMPTRHFIDPSSKDQSHSQLQDQSQSVNASKVIPI